MENVIKQLTLKNYIDILNNVSYGTTLVSYLNDSVRVEVADAIKIINEIVGLEVIREVPHTEGWEETHVSGVYAIIYSDKDNAVPQITEDDMNISYTVKEAFEKSMQYRLGVNKALWKRVKKECKAVGVKFSTDYDDVCVIDGRKKSQSVYKRIQEAYKSGQASVAFDIEEVNAPTVRTYSSQFGSAMGLKIRCSTMPGFITVHFREADPKDVLLQEFKSVLDKMKYHFSYTDILDIVNGKKVTDSPEFDLKSISEGSVSGQAWQNHTLQMENEFSKFSTGVADGILKKYHEGQNYEQEAPEYAQAGFDNESDYLDYLSEQIEQQPDIIKEVEGLQQYVMPIADAEPKKPTVEYDDF